MIFPISYSQAQETLSQPAVVDDATVSVDTVNINTADAETLAAQLAGVGPAKATAIIEYREKHGLFKSPADIMLVSGIGEKTFEKNKERIVVSLPTPEPQNQPEAQALPTDSTPVAEPSTSDETSPPAEPLVDEPVTE